MSRLATIVLACLLLGTGGCSGPAAPTGPAVTAGHDAVRITADRLAFDPQAVTAPAGKPFQIEFENREAAPHHVAIYADSGFATSVFREPVFSGPKTVVYVVPALSAATYYFRCDIHPTMKGTITAADPRPGLHGKRHPQPSRRRQELAAATCSR